MLNYTMKELLGEINAYVEAQVVQQDQKDKDQGGKGNQTKAVK
jgi:hypothetical protein